MFFLKPAALKGEAAGFRTSSGVAGPGDSRPGEDVGAAGKQGGRRPRLAAWPQGRSPGIISFEDSVPASPGVWRHARGLFSTLAFLNVLF